MISSLFAVVNTKGKEMDPNTGRVVAVDGLTYNDLIVYFERTIAAEMGEQQRRSRLSALTQFREHCGPPDGIIGTELNGRFEVTLKDFIESREGTSGTKNNLKSFLRGWQRLYEALLESRVESPRFSTLHDAFGYYYRNAKELNRKLTLTALARESGVCQQTLSHWLRDKNCVYFRQSSLEAAQRIEAALGAPKGALTVFAKVAVSALEAFINTIAYFASDAAAKRPISLPTALLADTFDYQRHTELTQKWADLGAALCVSWPPSAAIWTNFTKLLQIRNELVHYKAEGFNRVAPMEKILPEQLRNLPPEIILRNIPGSWPVRLLTPSFSRWSVSVARDLIAYFQTNYRFALSSTQDAAQSKGRKRTLVQ